VWANQDIATTDPSSQAALAPISEKRYEGVVKWVLGNQGSVLQLVGGESSINLFLVDPSVPFQ